MQAIAAVDRKWGIGNQGKLLVHIPEDQRRFRTITQNKILIYGRKTLATFPRSQPLQGRRNIILSSQSDFLVPGAEVVHSKEELLSLVEGEEKDSLMVIGGAMVYRELLPQIDRVFITRIDYQYEADAYFPNLDEDLDWHIREEGEEKTYFDLPYTFVEYERAGQE